MSRRLRTKIRSKKTQMGLNHHSQYSQSTTYFPQSYSIFGTPITMPTKILPLYSNNALNYIGQEGQLLASTCPIFQLTQHQCSSIKQANITISGKISSQSHQKLNKMLFFISMACCCLMSIFSMGWTRRKIYTRYQMQYEQYEAICQIIDEKLFNCDKLIINIQDNQFSFEKAAILVRALHDFYEKKSDKNNRTVLLRNYCYFMNQLGFQREFEKLYHTKNGRFVFIWEKYIKDSKNVEFMDDPEQERLANQSIFQC